MRQNTDLVQILFEPIQSDTDMIIFYC